MQTLGARILVPSFLATSMLLAGCGGGGGGGGGGSDGTLSVAITDNASDQIDSFVVQVTQVQLHKASGATVNVLSAPSSVDLATLTDTSQILNVGNVPAGTYLSASITLDFTGASCFLPGHATAAAILDSDGAPLTGPVTLPIQLGLHPLALPVNRHKLLEFDFDLDQSVTVDAPGNSVTVEPAFVLRIDPASPKPFVVVGTLASVDAPGDRFVVNVTTLGGAPIGTTTFEADTTTIFQIDGVPGQGATGLAALSAVPIGTSIQALGTVVPTSPHVHALVVEAGTGTYNGGTDIVEGHVVDRVGGAGADAVLTVLGRSSNAAHTVFQFNTSFTVSTSFANTKVVRSLVNQAFDTDDVNVGQRVRIFGALSGTNLDATAADAVVRLQPTRVLGFAAGAPSAGTLTIDLARVDLRPDTAFTWADGGTTPPDPNAFTIQVGSLGSGLGIVAGTPVEARGFFPAVDDGNDDFVASSLVNRDLVPSLLFVRDRPGGFTVTTTTSATDVQLAIAGVATTGEVAVIDQGFVGIQPLPTSPTPTIVPSASGPRFYTIRDKGTGGVTLYLDFAAFSGALGSKLGQGATLRQFAAIGMYTSATNTIAANLASAVVE
jgi:hypothetical protein